MMLEWFLEACESDGPPIFDVEIRSKNFSQSQYYTNRMAIYKTNKFHAPRAIETYQIGIM